MVAQFAELASTEFIVLAVIGSIMTFVGGNWIVLIAFAESIWCGLCYIFVPFYGLYYGYSRFELIKRPFFTSLVGLGIYFASIYLAYLA